ncbi:tetratricopeptide repeat protein, partial [Massilia cavernae]
KAAAAKLAKDPSDAAAMIARTQAILGTRDGRFDEAAAQAEKCIAAHPENGGCHLALGKALGTKAMAGGISSAIGYAGTIRDSFKKAVALNPRDYEARFSLMEYYMMAPFIVGGGTGKAEALAKETAAINPEAGRMMLAHLDLNDDKVAKAEAAVLAAKPGADGDLQQRQESLLNAIGGSYMSGKKFADASRVLREAQKRYPESPDVVYMMGRVQQEQGQHREALAAFEQALVKTPYAHVHYRMAKSLQALGEKARAVAAFEKAMSFKNGLGKASRADAEAQLKSLKG